MNILISALSVIGLIISSYAYFLKQKVRKQPEHKSFCDLNDRFSCTKPLLSPYANLFYFSYAAFGVLFYALILLLSFLDMHNYIYYLTIIGLIGSAVFAYILYFKIKSICLLCTSLYIINILLFILAFKNY